MTQAAATTRSRRDPKEAAETDGRSDPGPPVQPTAPPVRSTASRPVAPSL